MKESNKIIVEKIRYYALQTLDFNNGLTFEEFSADAKTISACFFNLSQIGELVGKLETDLTESNSHIPWRKIKGMCNKIVHDYEGIQLNIVWDVLTEFIPQLVENINVILKV